VTDDNVRHPSWLVIGRLEGRREHCPERRDPWSTFSDGSGATTTTTTGNVYLLPPDGEEFSTAQTNNSGPITLEAPAGSLSNGASSFTLAPQRAYRDMLCSGKGHAVLGQRSCCARATGTS
jgi:hypothetical protein